MSELLNNELNLGPHPQYPKSVKPGIPRLAKPKPGWKTYRIGDVFEVINRPVSMEDETTYQLVTVKRARGGVCEREKLKGKQISVKSQFYVKSGDFLISKRQIVHGACGFVPEELDGAIVSNEYAVLHCKDKLLPRFLNYLMHTPYFQQTCFHSSIGVHVEKMIFKLEDWFKQKINIPSISEQAYIADSVEKIDCKLMLLTKKVELLNRYKFSLVSNIFYNRKNQHINNTLNNFTSTSVRLEDAADIVMGSSPSSSAYNETGVGVPLLQGNADIKFRRTVPRVYTTEVTKTCNKGDILMSVRAPVGHIAVSDHDACIGRGLCSIRAKAKYNQSFLFQYLLWYEKRWSRLSQGSTFDSINSDEIKSLKLPAPPFASQVKIAEILSSIDQKVEAVEQQIKKLERFKQGLLQQMFV